jgi:splicing factor U2AF subunit
MLTAEAADPVLSVWLSPEGTYAFVEFHTVEAANNGLGLNGLMLLTSALRISRPNNYQPTVGINIDGIMAMANSGGCAASAPPAAMGMPGMAMPQPSSGPMLAAMSQLQSLSGSIGGVAPAAPPMPPALLTSTVLACANMLTKDELMDDEEREGLKEDVGEECKKFGKVLAMKIPTSGNENCQVYIKFSSISEASIALKALAGRKFDGRVVEVTSIPEGQFDVILDGK